MLIFGRFEQGFHFGEALAVNPGNAAVKFNSHGTLLALLPQSSKLALLRAEPPSKMFSAAFPSLSISLTISATSLGGAVITAAASGPPLRPANTPRKCAACS